ncbi:uncharacterized protein LOC131500957 [Neofelis nebulosa]|uniref:uncharacterized protein LOC131500957 n=1 Tax=Neofelis nebulosa TaxID=61452 RepID=UPI00272C02C6|nr:uncharacterized protein LOC131500957 [Neofelis nebulosa]
MPTLCFSLRTPYLEQSAHRGSPLKSAWPKFLRFGNSTEAQGDGAVRLGGGWLGGWGRRRNNGEPAHGSNWPLCLDHPRSRAPWPRSREREGRPLSVPSANGFGTDGRKAAGGGRRLKASGGRNRAQKAATSKPQPHIWTCAEGSGRGMLTVTSKYQPEGPTGKKIPPAPAPPSTAPPTLEMNKIEPRFCCSGAEPPPTPTPHLRTDS